MPSAFLHPFAKPTRESFIKIVRGDGALVFDSDGKEYIDGMASLWYCAVGHGRREIADAIGRQAATLAAYSTFDPFTNEPVEALAERLMGISPIPGARVFFACSGSESVDTAMKLSRLAHVLDGQAQRTLIISRVRGYHGTAYGGTSAQGIAQNKEHFGPFVDNVVQVPADDVEALASLMATRSNEIAAVLTEPVQGAAGVFPPADGYLPSLRRLCDQHGAHLIFDEVITGFGRLGQWFGAHYYGVTPDLVTFAKAITSGYQPLGGVFVGPAIRRPLEANPDYLLRTGFTYSGHPTACAAAMANLDIIEREQLIEGVTRMGSRLADGLRSLANDGQIDHVRGAGGVWAMGLRDDQDAFVVRDRLLAAGVIARATAVNTNTFCPPFVTTDAQIDRIVDAVDQATR
jgi:putrescine---pyruvate transaminase